MAKAKYSLTNAAANRIFAAFAESIKDKHGFGLLKCLDDAIHAEGLRGFDRRENVLFWMAENGKANLVKHIARELSRELDYARRKLREVANSCQSVVDEVNSMKHKSLTDE
jgi:hypothetical protein